MSRNSAHIALLVLCMTLLCACRRTAPQRPSRPSDPPKVDSALLALMDINRHLADAADTELVRWVRQQSAEFVQIEDGVWLQKPLPAQGGVTPRQDERWNIHLQVRRLDGTLLADRQLRCLIGRKALPDAVETVVALMHDGDSALVAAPWYTAYGVQGYDAVPPYENVLFRIGLTR